MATPAKQPVEAPETTGPLIYHRMIAVMREIDAIGKDKRNAQQGFNYRGVDQVYNELHPILTKHGVFMTAEVLNYMREDRQTAKGGTLIYTSLHMRYRFHAEDGSSVATDAQGEGMDSGDKASNKAMAVAHKYAILQAFCIPTEDMPDPDADSHQVMPRGAVRSPNMTEIRPTEVQQLPDVDESTVIRLSQAIEGSKSQEAMDRIWKETGRADIAALRVKMPQGYDEIVAAFKKRKEQLTAKETA